MITAAIWGQMVLDEDEDWLPEHWAASERVTRIFSVRMREAVATEGMTEDICECKGAK